MLPVNAQKTRFKNTRKQLGSTTMSNLHTSFNRSLHENNFSRLALRHYQVNAYLWQARIGGFMMEQTSLGHECRLLCIQGTGSGKSVLYQTLAAHYRSVTI